MEGLAGLTAVGLTVGGREAAGIAETPPGRNVGNGDARVRVGLLEVVVRGGEPDAPQIGDGRNVLVFTESLLQGAWADPGGAGDLGEPDIGVVVVVDKRAGASQRRGTRLLSGRWLGPDGGDRKSLEDLGGHQP